MLQSFGWIFFLLIAVVLIGIAALLQIRRRKRAAAERRAVWKAHQDWLRNSATKKPAAAKPPHAEDGPSVGHG